MLGHIGRGGDEGRKRRRVRCPHHDETLINHRWRLLREREEQSASRSESMDQGRRGESDFVRDVGEREAHRTEAADGARRRREDCGVLDGSRTGRHGLIDSTWTLANEPAGAPTAEATT